MEQESKQEFEIGHFLIVLGPSTQCFSNNYDKKKLLGRSPVVFESTDSVSLVLTSNN